MNVAYAVLSVALALTADAARPDLPTAVAAVTAGGGFANFSSTLLLSVLAGKPAGAPLARLTRTLGAATVKQSIVVNDFVVADARRLIDDRGYKLPVASSDTLDARALATALYRDGLDAANRRYRVETMFDRLVTRAVRVGIWRDVDARFGRPAGVHYRRALALLIDDLRDADDGSTTETRGGDERRATPRGVARFHHLGLGVVVRDTTTTKQPSVDLAGSIEGRPPLPLNVSAQCQSTFAFTETVAINRCGG